MLQIDSLYKQDYEKFQILHSKHKEQVMEATHTSSVKVLLKSFKKSKLYKYKYDWYFQREVPLELYFLIRLNEFPFVPRYYNYLEGKDWSTIVMELLENEWKSGYHFFKILPEESVTKRIFKNIINYVYEMAKSGFYHVDLKPKNIMVNTKTFDVKFIDFENMVFNKHEDPKSSSIDGTIGFKSPESYGGNCYEIKPSLVFNMGCLAYSCLEYKIPFQSEADTRRSSPLKTLKSSLEAESFIQECTCRNKELRMDFHEMLEHPWFS